MIQMQKDGAELADKLAEIQMLHKSEAVRTAAQMARVSAMLDAELRELRRQEREGRELIAQGVTLMKLNEILKALDGRNSDDAC